MYRSASSLWYTVFYQSPVEGGGGWRGHGGGGGVSQTGEEDSGKGVNTQDTEVVVGTDSSSVVYLDLVYQESSWKALESADSVCIV